MVGPPETLKAQPTQPSWGWAYNATAGAISARLFGMKCDFFLLHHLGVKNQIQWPPFGYN